MKLKYFSLFLLFLLGMHSAIAQGSNCNLPAPENLVNTVNDPTFVAFTFSPVQGASGYQVQITYPSGASGHTFQLNDPNTSSFSATVLNESITVGVAAMKGNCVSQNQAVVTMDKIIIMDLVAGLSPPDNRSTLLCEHGNLPPFDMFSCSVDNYIGSSYCLEFLDGEQLVQVMLFITSVQEDLKIEVKRCSNQFNGWQFSDDIPMNSSISPYAVNNSSHYFSMTKRVSANGVGLVKIKVTARPEGNFHTRLEITREDETEYVINQVKIYQNEIGVNPHSDNQTNQSSNEYKVTPNPFSDHLNITIDTPEKGEVVVNLFDVTGSLRKTVTLPANELDNQNYTIATSDLLSGMYIMQVRTSAGVQQVSKVFKL